MMIKIDIFLTFATNNDHALLNNLDSNKVIEFLRKMLTSSGQTSNYRRYVATALFLVLSRLSRLKGEVTNL